MRNVNGGYSVNQYLFVRPGDCHLMCIACFLGETDEGWHDWQKFLMPYNLYLFNIEQACTFMVVTFSCKISIWPITSVLRVPFLYNGTSVPYWCIVTICFLLENWKFGYVIKFPSILKRCWRQLNSLLLKEWWTYVCMGPSDPHPNWHLGMRGSQHRAVMWRVWKEGGTGFLYWGANCYEKATVPSAEVFAWPLSAWLVLSEDACPFSSSLSLLSFFFFALSWQ